jgi:hypothetical protein
MRGPHLALAALISAYRQSDDSDGLRATLPLVGGTLVEHQARQAARAGATHIVILVERLPAALTGAIDALRADGLAVDIARSVGDAADRVHPDERLLVIADGCVVGQSAIDRIAAADAPALLTLADEPGRDAFERIDGGSRWAGLALIDGARLRSTAAMLGDWDVESTLLRRAVQENARRISVFEAEAGSVSAGLPIIAETARALADLERQLLIGSRRQAASWPARFIFAPVEEPIAGLLLRRAAEPQWIAMLGAALAAIAAPLAAMGWFWAALLALLLSGPVAAVAGRLAAVRLAAIRRQRLFEGTRTVGAVMALLLFVEPLVAERGWGWWCIAGLAIAGMAALMIERRIAAGLTLMAEPIWLASLDGLIWGFLPFAVAGHWPAGVAALAGYAILSFIFVQRRAWRKVNGLVSP